MELGEQKLQQLRNSQLLVRFALDVGSAYQANQEALFENVPAEDRFAERVSVEIAELPKRGREQRLVPELLAQPQVFINDSVFLVCFERDEAVAFVKPLDAELGSRVQPKASVFTCLKNQISLPVNRVVLLAGVERKLGGGGVLVEQVRLELVHVPFCFD